MRESFDQGVGFGCAGVCRLAGCMVLGQDCDSCFRKRYTYCLHHRLNSEHSPGSEVQDLILWPARWRGFMNERPASVEYRGTESFRNIEHGQERWLRFVGQFLPVHKWRLADG